MDAIAAMFGENTLINTIFGFVYVWWWVGLVPASLLLGPVFRAISPARTISMLLARVSGAPEGGVDARGMVVKTLLGKDVRVVGDG